MEQGDRIELIPELFLEGRLYYCFNFINFLLDCVCVSVLVSYMHLEFIYDHYFDT